MQIHWVLEAKRVQVREAEAGFHSNEMRLDLDSQCSSTEACLLHLTSTRALMSYKVMTLEADAMLTLICRWQCRGYFRLSLKCSPYILMIGILGHSLLQLF